MIEGSNGLNSGQKGSRKSCVRIAELSRYRTYLGSNMEINALHKCQASNLYFQYQGYPDMVEEVCSICYRFLQSIHDHKRMKNIRKMSGGSIIECKSIYHKKLTDSFKS
jgi:hypothetical protein